MRRELSKAFKKLREQNDFLKERNIPKEYRYDDELDIIETALKDYEELNKDYSVVVKEKIALGVMYVKEHRIVGIIKNKGIDILKLKECTKCKTPNEYNKRTSYSYHKDLDQEEFDLAKEMLL